MSLDGLKGARIRRGAALLVWLSFLCGQVSIGVNASEFSVSPERESGTAVERSEASGEQSSQSNSAALDDLLGLEQARDYLLELINRDRAKNNLAPVVLDACASGAAQYHAEDSARRGFSDHYDPEGRSPDLRYSMMGCTNMIAENNVGPYCDSKWKYKLAPQQRFSKKQVENIESAFFDESPPRDGHRKNILKPEHNRVGLGLALCNATNAEGFTFQYVSCCEEFVDAYGVFNKLPLNAKPSDLLILRGKLDPDVKLYCVDVRCGELPKGAPISDLRRNAYRSYQIPDARVQAFWPSDAHFEPDGGFTLEMPLAPTWKKGLYYFAVWVKKTGMDAFVTSLQTVAVGADRQLQPLK